MLTPLRGESMPRVEVAVCSSAAFAQGVRVGMPVAEAQALAPQLVILPHEQPRDRQELAKLAEACEQFSPCVGLEEGDEPESLLLDISNLEHLWGSEAKLVSQVEKFFKRRGYRVRLAVADMVGLAWAMAHWGARGRGLGTREGRESRVEGREPEDAFTICNSPAPSPQPPASRLPVEALRISAETAKLLRELGIETIDQLQPLPREELASRFGDELLRRLDQLTGAVSEIIVPHRARAALDVGWSLEQPTADRGMLAHVLGQLVEQLSRQLAARDEGAVLLMCLLRCTGGNMVPLRIGLLQPSANARQLMELVELNLETVRLAEEVDRVEIRVAVVGRLGERQGELFADRWPTDPHQLALLANRLSSRLGHEQVLRAELGKSPVPERAVKLLPVTQLRGKKLQSAKRKLKKANWRNSAINNLQFAINNLQFSPRPLLLHPAPEALEAVCVAPDGPPQFIWLAGRRQRIAHHAGPERIETLWWRGQSVRRDYYRVALESGSHLWIFRRLADRKWFLHGEFQ
jgi:protein ImuB